MQPKSSSPVLRRVCALVSVSLIATPLSTLAGAQSAPATSQEKTRPPDKTAPAPFTEQEKAIKRAAAQTQDAFNKGEYARVLELCPEGLKLLDDKYLVYKMIFLNWQATSYERLKQLEKAIDCYTQALAVARQMKDGKWIVNYLMSIAGDNGQLGRYKQEEALLKGALQEQRHLPADPGQEATLLSSMAEVKNALHKPDEALQNHKAALRLYTAQNKNWEQVQCLCQMASIYYQQGDINSVLEVCRQAGDLTDRMSNIEEKAGAFLDVGGVYQQTQQHELALKAYETARMLVKDMKIKAPALRMKAAYIPHLMAQCSWDIGDYNQALKTNQEGIDELPFAPIPAQYIPLLLGNLWGQRAQFFDFLYEYNEALKAADKAYHLYADVGQEREMTGELLNKARIYARLGRYNDAWRDLTTAGEKLKAAENFRLTVQDSIQVYSTMDNIYSSLGQHGKALECSLQSYNLAQGNTSKLMEGMYAILLANAYLRVGDFPKAQHYSKEAIDKLKSLGNNARIAHALLGMGSNYILQGQSQDNDQHLFQAGTSVLEDALRRAELSNDKHAIASVKNTLALAYVALKKYDTAIPLLESSLKLFDDMGYHKGQQECFDILATAYRKKNDITNALGFNKKALEIARNGQERSDVAHVLINQARIHERQGNLAGAEAALAEARGMYEAMSTDIVEGSDVGAFQQYRLQNMYAWEASIRHQRRHYADALTLVERGRAQGLARQAAQSHASLSRYLSPAEAEQLHTASIARNRAYRAIRAISNGSTPVSYDTPVAGPGQERPQPLERKQSQEQEQQGNARRSFHEANIKLAQLRDSLLQRYPEYRRLQGQAPSTYADLQRLAQNSPDTLYLEYAVVDDDTTLLFALSKRDGLHTLVLPVGKSRLEKMVAKWRTLCVSPYDADDAQAENTCASALYRTLLAPLASATPMLQPGRYARLVIVADGALLDAPLAALRDGNGQRLVDRYAVSTAVSLGVLTWPQTNRQAPTQTLLCAADPTGEPQQVVSLRRGGWGAMEAAREEGTAIAKLFPTDLLTGPQVREAAVKQAMGRYQILHFATHGLGMPQNGLGSYLVLAPEPKDSVEDGILEAREVAEMPLSAQLAVLSACETGQGQKSGGEGLLGLPWAFRVAGCPSVVASQWQVDSEATRKLMTAFYKELKSGKRKDAALRTAMQTVRREKEYQSPYYWAAFEVIGDTGALRFPKSNAASQVPVAQKQPGALNAN